MPTYSFGSGVLTGTRTDVPNATPINFGLAQTVSIDVTSTTKELYGQYQFPVAIARGTGKIAGKATVASISAIAWGNLFFGQAPTPGQTDFAYAEAAAVPAATPYQVTVANGAAFVADHGVVNAATGNPLSKVASAPVAGQYSVAAGGVYTFASTDQGAALLISYTFNAPNSGQSIKYTNKLLGDTPTFSAKFWQKFQGKTVSCYLPKCTSSKLMVATKLEDFVIPEIDFSAFADDSGTVMKWDFSEVS